MFKKLLITIMAMTMVAGMSLTVLAADSNQTTVSGNTVSDNTSEDEATPDSTPDVEVEPEAKPEVKPEAKPEVKPEAKPSKPSFTYEVEDVVSSTVAQSFEGTVKYEEAIPVTSFFSTAAINALPAEVKELGTANVFNLSKVTTTQGFVAAVNKIAKANPTVASVTLYSEKPIAFNVKSLAALTDANMEFVYMFNHEGHLYKVTIPAGAKVDLEGARFAGPLFIGAKLGTSVLVK